jgi:hypothetical protein
MTIPDINPSLDRLFATIEKRKEAKRNERQRAEDRKLEQLTRRKALWWQDKPE